MSKQYKNIRLIQDFIIPALDQKTYGDLLVWDSQPGVFKIKWTHKARSSWTEEDSRVFIAWDQLKGRSIPKTHQEFVDSKQRLRAALRNLRTIEDVPSNDDYRRYRITDLLEIRIKSGKKTQITEIKTELEDIPVLPRRRSRRKVKVEKCMYNDEDSSESWTEHIKPPRKPKRQVHPKKNTCVKETGECYKIVSEPSGNKSVIENSAPSEHSTKRASEGLLAQEIKSVLTKESGAIPKIKITASNPKVEIGPRKETSAAPKPKLPRSLACILDSQNINYDRGIAPRRTTKVSQEVWAASLSIKQEEPVYSSSEKQMEPNTSKYQDTEIQPRPNVSKTMISAEDETPNDSIPAPKVSVHSEKTSKVGVSPAEVSVRKKKESKDGEKKSKNRQKKKKSKGDKKKSSSEPSLTIKPPINRESVEDLTEKLEASASADGARACGGQVPVQKVTQKKQPVSQNPFAGDINSMYSEAYLATKHDEAYLTKAWLGNDRDCPWFLGKGSSDFVIEIEFPPFESKDFTTPLDALGVRLNALEKLTSLSK